MRMWFADDLRAYFARHGSVTEAFVVYDKLTGKSRGTAFVTFAEPSSVAKVTSRVRAVLRQQ